MLVRRQGILARPVSLLRNYLLPLAALLLLLVKATEVSAEATSVRVVAAVFGFVVPVMLLSVLNATVFQGAPEGSIRAKCPRPWPSSLRVGCADPAAGARQAYALDEVTVLQIDRAHMEELVLRKPLLLREIGRAIEDRRANVPRVLAMAGD